MRSTWSMLVVPVISRRHSWKACLSSSSEQASRLSILLPRMATGTPLKPSISDTVCNSCSQIAYLLAQLEPFPLTCVHHVDDAPYVTAAVVFPYFSHGVVASQVVSFKRKSLYRNYIRMDILRRSNRRVFMIY